MERKNSVGHATGRIFIPFAFLSLCFVIGAVVGQVLAFTNPVLTAPELRESLNEYCQRRNPDTVTLSLTLSALWVWFRVPVLAFLWGFTSLGVPLCCLTVSAFGFFLSFSVGSFAAAFGWQGVLISAAALGIRTLISLPCVFLLCLSSMERAAWLSGLAAGRLRRPGFCPAQRTRRFTCTFCVAVLLLGTALDIACTPRLLRLILPLLSLAGA